MKNSFITSIIEKHILILLRIILTNVQWSTYRSLLYSFAKYKERYTIGLVHSILYRTYDWGIGNDFHSLFYFLPWSGFESLLNFTPLQHRQELFLWLFHFELFQNLDKVCTYWKTYQASWSISIDLDAQYVSSFAEVFLLKNSFQILLYAFQKNCTSFLINNMLLTYIYQKGGSAPTHFIVNTGFTASLYKTICLHQSIDGSL